MLPISTRGRKGEQEADQSAVVTLGLDPRVQYEERHPPDPRLKAEDDEAGSPLLP